jgi:hypothetical protein
MACERYRPYVITIFQTLFCRLALARILGLAGVRDWGKVVPRDGNGGYTILLKVLKTEAILQVGRL